MSVVTGLSVSLNNTNYSRYSTVDGANVITATITISPTGVSLADTLNVFIYRTPTYQGGAQYVQTYSGGTQTGFSTGVPTIPQPKLIYFDQISIAGSYSSSNNTITYTVDLTTIHDRDGFINTHFSYIPNDYTFMVTTQAMSFENVWDVTKALTFSVLQAFSVVAQANFTILAISVAEMRQRWLFGLPLVARLVLQALVQPSAITGLTITNVGFNTQRGNYPVSFTPPNTFTFNNGPPIVITGSTGVLYDNNNNNVTVTVNQSALPGSTTSSNTLLEYEEMADTYIIQQILQSTFDTQRGIKARLEPTNIVSRLLLQYAQGNSSQTMQSDLGGTITDTNGNSAFIPITWDEICDGVSFFKQRSAMQWVLVETPFLQILKVTQLVGFFNQQVTVVIPHNWITHDVSQGIVQLVPTNYAILNWILAQAAFYFFINSADYIPNFWGLDLKVGFRQGINEDIREYIGMNAALPLLIQASQALYPAYTGYSVSRDGVAESASFLPGMYAYYIALYNDMLGRVPGQMVDGKMKALRQSYVGWFMRTL